MSEFPGMDNRVFFSPVQQFPEEALNSNFFLRESFTGKCIFFITFPPTREIFPDITMTIALCMGHKYFGTVKDLRNTSCSKNIYNTCFKQIDIHSNLHVKATHIVIVRKNHQVIRIGIEKIVYKDFIKSDQSIIPGFFFSQTFLKCALKRKIHKTGQVWFISVAINLSFLPI